MGLIAFLVVFELVGPPLLVFVVILIASARGYPRRSGRRAYAIAVVPLALFSAGMFQYFRGVVGGPANHFNLPPLPLFYSIIITAAASIACLLAAFLYGVASSRSDGTNRP